MPPASQSLKPGAPILNFAFFAKFRVGTLSGPPRHCWADDLVPWLLCDCSQNLPVESGL
jgi:hypothetical protein